MSGASQLDSEAAKTSEIRLFDVINHEKRKGKHAPDHFFRSLLECQDAGIPSRCLFGAHYSTAPSHPHSATISPNSA